MSETLGVPVCKMTMDEVKTSFGGTSVSDSGNTEIDDSTFFGGLLSCIIKTGVKNPIIFIDEAGEYLKVAQTAGSSALEFWKVLLDSEELTFPVWNKKLMIDISRVTFILAGNHALVDPSLKQKLSQIAFIQVTPEVKRRVAYENMDAILNDFAPPTVSGECYELIDSSMKSLVPYILKQDKSEGARVVEKLVRGVADYLLGLCVFGSEFIQIEGEKKIDEMLSQM